MSFTEKKPPRITITTDRPDSRESASDKTPRTARFAEATSVYSPIDPPAKSNPFADPPVFRSHFMPQPQVSDVGFGYLGKTGHESVEMEETDTRYLPPPTPKSPLKSPLKSALKSPGAAPRHFEALKSPTFHEETILEKAEAGTDVEQAKDLKIKTRVRAAKFFLRGINFSCSLIVLSMLSSTFAIFNATKSLPARNKLPAWAPNTQIWPQVTLLSIACFSLFMCVVIFFGYARGGHRRAEKVAVYYTSFAVLVFIFSIVMWGVGAAMLNQSRATGNGKDIWGWSCKDGPRKSLFQEDVNYALICRLQNWSLVCCIIEVVVEVLTIAVYGIVFFRYYTKRRLRKSMAVRDRARSDLYLAQLRSQSAPNTPGFGPMSPSLGGWRPPPGHPNFKDPNVTITEKEQAGVQYATVPPSSGRTLTEPKPFSLQAPPIKIHAATPKTDSNGFSPVRTKPAPLNLSAAPVAPALASPQTVSAHAPVAQGEVQYGAVAIPGGYTGEPLNSPGFAPTHRGQAQTFDFGLDSRITR